MAQLSPVAQMVFAWCDLAISTRARPPLVPASSCLSPKEGAWPGGVEGGKIGLGSSSGCITYAVSLMRQWDGLDLGTSVLAPPTALSIELIQRACSARFSDESAVGSEILFGRPVSFLFLSSSLSFFLSFFFWVYLSLSSGNSLVADMLECSLGPPVLQKRTLA